MNECVTGTENAASQFEINISNTSAENKIVLNDLKLLQLLNFYSFLINNTERESEGACSLTESDTYDDWGWKQLAMSFNMSYVGVKLLKPFSAQLLRTRWKTLRHICPLLANSESQLSSSLRDIVHKVNNMPTTISFLSHPLTPAQQLILSQLPFLEQLSETQKRQLEGDVLEAIFAEERQVQLEVQELSSRQIDEVNNECEEIINAIGARDIIDSFAETCSVSSAEELDSSSQDSTAYTVSNCPNNIISTVCSPTSAEDIDSSSQDSTARQSNIIISSVRSSTSAEDVDSNSQDSGIQSPYIVKCGDRGITICSAKSAEEVDFAKSELDIKPEPTDDYFVEPTKLVVRFVPLKCAHQYVKKCVVRIKRLPV
ncbi:uncharacterized protein LOC108596300 [Drosophila busckii]|uniref:uncharacterized protein LOC108596300 n=1 Tax=Drosophila busckii TaxID=30019 RepID=UPI00083F4607|nr:uncharacterized protein LOC108596300 [Drosophila busckii]